MGRYRPAGHRNNSLTDSATSLNLQFPSNQNTRSIRNYLAEITINCVQFDLNCFNSEFVTIIAEISSDEAINSIRALQQRSKPTS